MEDSRNIIKAIDALTLKAGGEVVDSKNITEAIDRLKEVYSQEAIGIDDTLTQEGLAADAKAVGDTLSSTIEGRLNGRDDTAFYNVAVSYGGTESTRENRILGSWDTIVNTLRNRVGSVGKYVQFSGNLFLIGSPSMGSNYIHGDIYIGDNYGLGCVFVTQYAASSDNVWVVKKDSVESNPVITKLVTRSEQTYNSGQSISFNLNNNRLAATTNGVGTQIMFLLPLDKRIAGTPSLTITEYYLEIGTGIAAHESDVSINPTITNLNNGIFCKMTISAENVPGYVGGVLLFAGTLTVS